MGKDMPHRRANIPPDQNIPIRFTGMDQVLQHPRDRPQQAVMRDVIPVVHIDKQPAPRRQQPPALPHYLSPCRSGKDMAEHVPQARNGVESSGNLAQLLGSNRQLRLHRRTGLQQRHLADPGGLRDATRPRSTPAPMSRSDPAEPMLSAIRRSTASRYARRRFAISGKTGASRV